MKRSKSIMALLTAILLVTMFVPGPAIAKDATSAGTLFENEAASTYTGVSDTDVTDGSDTGGTGGDTDGTDGEGETPLPKIEYNLVSDDKAVTVSFTTTDVIPGAKVAWSKLTSAEKDAFSNKFDYTVDCAFALGNVKITDDTGKEYHPTGVKISFDLSTMLKGADPCPELELTSLHDFDDSEHDDSNYDDDYYNNGSKRYDYYDYRYTDVYDTEDIDDGGDADDEEYYDEDEEDAAETIEFDVVQDSYLINGNIYRYDELVGCYKYVNSADGKVYYYFPDNGEYVFSFGDKGGFKHENGEWYTYNPVTDRYLNSDGSDWFAWDEDDEVYYSNDGNYFYYYDDGFEYTEEDVNKNTDDADVDDEEADDDDENYSETEYGDGDFFPSEFDEYIWVFNGRYYYYQPSTESFRPALEYENEWGIPQVEKYTVSDGNYRGFSVEDLLGCWRYDDDDLDEPFNEAETLKEIKSNIYTLTDADDNYFYDKLTDRYSFGGDYYYYNKSDQCYYFDPDFNPYGYYAEGHLGYLSGYFNCFHIGKSGKIINENTTVENIARYYSGLEYRTSGMVQVLDKVGGKTSPYKLDPGEVVQVVGITDDATPYAIVEFTRSQSYNAKVIKQVGKEYTKKGKAFDSYEINCIGYVELSALTPCLEDYTEDNLLKVLHRSEGLSASDSSERFNLSMSGNIATVNSTSLSPFMLAGYWGDPDEIPNNTERAMVSYANTTTAKGGHNARPHNKAARSHNVSEDNTSINTDAEKLHGRGVFGKVSNEGRKTSSCPPDAAVWYFVNWVMICIALVVIVAVAAGVYLFRRRRARVRRT